MEYATGVDTSDLAVKRDCIVLKADVGKLDIKKLANVSSSLNDLKINVDDLFVGKLKTFMKDWEMTVVVENTKFKTINTKVNNLENKIPVVTTLIHTNQYNTGKQNLEKKLKILIEKHQIRVV